MCNFEKLGDYVNFEGWTFLARISNPTRPMTDYKFGYHSYIGNQGKWIKDESEWNFEISSLHMAYMASHHM